MKNNEYEKIIWMLDQRFDFLLPWFTEHYNVSLDDILFVGSYHGAGREGLNTKVIGNVLKGHITFLEPEDINRLYACELEQDKKTLIIPFTGAYLPTSPKLTVPIATGQIAIDANNKKWQYAFFEHLNIPTPKTWCFEDSSQLKEKVWELLKEHDKLIIKRAEASGGYRMYSITSVKELRTEEVQPEPGDLRGEVLVSEYLQHEQSFAGMGVVSKDGQIHWCGVTEQVLYNNHAYEGLIFPPYLDKGKQALLEKLTVQVGRALAQKGYWGFYNVDYILSGKELYAVEINARFGFGTLLFALTQGKDFWRAVTEGITQPGQTLKCRLLLGKLKGREGRIYEKLTANGNIVQWFQNGEGEFGTLFCGVNGPETFTYGSFIGLFGAFLPKKVEREEALQHFWRRCLEEYK